MIAAFTDKRVSSTGAGSERRTQYSAMNPPTPSSVPVADGSHLPDTRWRLLHGHAAQPTPTQFRVETEHWRPYRSVASWYMWRAVDLHRG